MTPEPLVCAVCLYVRDGVASPAITVIEGYAVCEDHLGYVAQGTTFATIVRSVRREEAVAVTVAVNASSDPDEEP